MRFQTGQSYPRKALFIAVGRHNRRALAQSLRTKKNSRKLRVRCRSAVEAARFFWGRALRARETARRGEGSISTRRASAALHYMAIAPAMRCHAAQHFSALQGHNHQIAYLWHQLQPR